MKPQGWTQTAKLPVFIHKKNTWSHTDCVEQLFSTISITT